MTTWFDQCFDKLISHEGGYVKDSSIAVKYMNESKCKSHSRILRNFNFVAGVGNLFSSAIGGFNLHPSEKLSRIWMFCGGLRAPSLRQKPLQRSLHSNEKRTTAGRSSSSKEAGRRLHGVREVDGYKGWMGHVSASLSSSSVRVNKGCGDTSVWLQMRTLQWKLPSFSFRFSSPWRQAWVSEQYAYKLLAKNIGEGAFQVHIAVRKLPSAGALR